MTKKTTNTNKNSQTGTGSWANIRKRSQGNRVQSRSMAKVIHRYEYRTQGKSQKLFFR